MDISKYISLHTNLKFSKSILATLSTMFSKIYFVEASPELVETNEILTITIGHYVMKIHT